MMCRLTENGQVVNEIGILRERTMATCVLIDCRDGMATRQTVILSADHLRETLALYADREPAIVRLEGMAGLLARIGFGGSVGVVLVTGVGGRRDEQIAAASTPHTQEAAAFQYLGEQVQFAPKHLLPAAVVVDIVIYLYRTRELPSWVHWEKRNAVK
jgi:hypothetical protein